jgi:hypothetical protein
LGRTRSKSEVRGKRVRGVTRVELVRAPATFEWPPHHRAYLEELLPSVTKILIIGWQAKEAHFLQMLRERLPMGGRRVAHILVVGKNSADAKATLHFFASELGQSGYNQPHSYANAGFSQFVANREGEAFLRA